jgi:hypothetical protein
MNATPTQEKTAISYDKLKPVLLARRQTPPALATLIDALRYR